MPIRETNVMLPLAVVRLFVSTCGDLSDPPPPLMIFNQPTFILMLDQGQMVSTVRICVHLSNRGINIVYNITIDIFPSDVLSEWSKISQLAFSISVK